MKYLDRSQSQKFTQNRKRQITYLALKSLFYAPENSSNCGLHFFVFLSFYRKKRKLLCASIFFSSPFPHLEKLEKYVFDSEHVCKNLNIEPKEINGIQLK